MQPKEHSMASGMSKFITPDMLHINKKKRKKKDQGQKKKRNREREKERDRSKNVEFWNR